MSHPQPSPILAVSAAIFRDRKLLVVRRRRTPAGGLFTLPGGRVEPGETLVEAVAREITEETALEIEIVGLSGYREVMRHDAGGALSVHYVILPFAARWRGGEVALSDEHDEARWVMPAELATLETTAGLAEIVETAAAMVR